MPPSSSNDFILVVPYYSRRLPTGRHGTARNFVEKGLYRNSRYPNWSPVDGSDLVVLRDLFPKVGKTTRPVGHSSTCTSDLYCHRVRLSRLCPSAGRAVPGLPALGPAGPDRTSPCGRAGPLRNATRLRRTRPGQVSARRLLNWSPVDGSDFVVVFLDFSNYHPVKVAKCLVTSSS